MAKTHKLKKYKPCSSKNKTPKNKFDPFLQKFKLYPKILNNIIVILQKDIKIEEYISEKQKSQILVFFEHIPKEILKKTSEEFLNDINKIISFLHQNPKELTKFFDILPNQNRIKGGTLVISNAVGAFTGKKSTNDITKAIIDLVLSVVCFAVAYYLITNIASDLNLQLQSLKNKSGIESPLQHIDFDLPKPMDILKNPNALDNFFSSLISSLTNYSKEVFTNTATTVLSTNENNGLVYKISKAIFSTAIVFKKPDVALKIVELSLEKIACQVNILMVDIKSILLAFNLSMEVPYYLINTGKALAGPPILFLGYKTAGAIKNGSLKAIKYLKDKIKGDQSALSITSSVAEPSASSITSSVAGPSALSITSSSMPVAVPLEEPSAASTVSNSALVQFKPRSNSITARTNPKRPGSF